MWEADEDSNLGADLTISPCSIIVQTLHSKSFQPSPPPSTSARRFGGACGIPSPWTPKVADHHTSDEFGTT